MFEESADDRDDADVFRKSFDAGAQNADAAHDQINFHADLRSPIERADDLVVGQTS